MGTCCSKIDNEHKHEISRFEGDPGLELQLRLQNTSDQQHWLSAIQVAGLHDTCQLLAGSAAPSRLHYTVKDLIYSRTNQLICKAEDRQGYETSMNSQSIGLSRHNNTSTHNLTHENLHDGCLVLGGTQYGTSSLPDDGGQDDDVDGHLLSSVNAVTVMSLSRRMAACNVHNIDHSDGIKLQVRFKHMFPQEAQTGNFHHVPLVEGHALKRARSWDKLVSVDSESQSSTRQCKVSRVYSNDHNAICEHESIMSRMRNDENDDGDGGGDDDDDDDDDDDGDYGDEDDDRFHDITLGVSIASLHEDYKRGLTCDHGGGGSVVWQERLAVMEAMKDMECTMLPLSVVSTGDAVLFSGSNSEEFHLIPSKFVQSEWWSSMPTSLDQNFSHPRPTLLRPLDHKIEKFSLDVEDIMLLLDDDELNEDDLLSLLMDSCVKSSQSSSPSSSCASSPSSASSIVLSASPRPLSLSSSSSTSSSSSGASVLPSSSCTEAPQGSSSSTPCAMPLPYSLSLPSSCTMYSPQTSFEFNVKPGNSAPSTPVFSPIRSRAKRSLANLKPSALTTEEIAEIWGMFEQRRASMVSPK